MSQVAPLPNTATGTASKSANGFATLTGRIVSARRINTQNGRQFVTIVKLPSLDEYTSPQTVELRSREALGQKDETVTVGVRIGGYGRSYEMKKEDPETGEITRERVQTADNSLTVVE